MSDKYNLIRFLEAQENIYESALRELKSGLKKSCWMWFIFPKIQGLGFSEMSKKFAITNKEEAKVYLDHKILGHRLSECTQCLIDLEGRTAHQIFSTPDDLKLRSCLTLFYSISPKPNLFFIALNKYYNGKIDQHTMDILKNISKG